MLDLVWDFVGVWRVHETVGLPLAATLTMYWGSRHTYSTKAERRKRCNGCTSAADSALTHCVKVGLDITTNTT